MWREWRRGADRLFLTHSLKKPSERSVSRHHMQQDVGVDNSTVAHPEWNKTHCMHADDRYMSCDVCANSSLSITSAMVKWKSDTDYWCTSHTTRAATLIHIFYCLVLTCCAFGWHLREPKPAGVLDMDEIGSSELNEVQYEVTFFRIMFIWNALTFSLTSGLFYMCVRAIWPS